MINPAKPPLVAGGTDGPRRWIRVPRSPCRHIRTSREMIHQAAESVRPERAIILGAGRCQEIPLSELVDRFASVTLNDHDPLMLEEALSTSGLSHAHSLKVETLVADLTGVTLGFLKEVAECLDMKREIQAATAAERIARLAETTQPDSFATGQKYDLVIASCVLCQLHLEACNRTIALYAASFPGHEAAFRTFPSWIQAMYGLARRIEDAFINAIHGLVAPGGRIYLSDTVQSAFLHPSPEGDWLTDGVYRMTRTNELSDYLDDRFQIERRGRWLWIIEPSQQAGTTGRIFNTQGLVLSLKSPPQ